MEITWDAEAKAIYIILPCEGKRENFHTVQVHGYDQLYLDYNRAHELCGIEILNASEPVIKDITIKAE